MDIAFILFVALVVVAYSGWIVGWFAHWMLPTIAARIYHVRKGKPAMALLRIALFVPALYDKKNRDYARKLYADLLFSHARYPEALVHYDRLVKSRGDLYTRSLVKRGDCLRALGRVDGAILAWKFAQEQAKDVPDGFAKFEALAESSARAGDFEASYAYYKSGLRWCVGRFSSMKPSVLYELTKTAHSLSLPQDTVSWAEQCIRSKPPDAQLVYTHSVAAAAYRELLDLDAAETHYRSVLDVSRRHAYAAYIALAEHALAVIAMLRGRLLEARESLTQMASSRDEPEVHNSLGNCHYILGKYDDAIGSYVHAIKHIDLDKASDHHLVIHGHSLINSAYCCAKMERWSDSESYMAQAIERYASHPEIRFAISATRANTSAMAGEIDSARAALEQIEGDLTAIRAVPHLARYCLDNIAAARYRIGEYEAAKSVLNSWLELGMYPVFVPRYFYYLGLCEEALDKQFRANEAFQNAVALEIPTIESQKAREKLGMPA